MMKFMLVLLMGLNFAVTPIATVDRIEGNYAVVEVGTKMIDIPTEDFNNPIAQGNQFPISMAIGGFEWFDEDGWYQFKSYDDAVWWALTTEEIGFVPGANKTYVLMYYNNDTTECLECAEEFDCECEVYDDIFLAVEELK